MTCTYSQSIYILSHKIVNMEYPVIFVCIVVTCTYSQSIYILGHKIVNT